jgi:23S rRNA pseudouridine1911/1915/1917 synthase
MNNRQRPAKREYSGGSNRRSDSRGGGAKPSQDGKKAAKPSTGAPTGARAQADKPVSRTYEVKDGTTLLPFLLEAVTGSGRNAIKSMLARGQISVNGTPATAYNHELAPGDKVEVRKERIVERPPLAGLTIVHEDDDLIVVVKDAGLLSIAADKDNEHELTAYRQLMAHVRSQDPKGRVFVVHRLDRDTSGIMMFAKNEAAQQTLQNEWQERVKERAYIALVDGMVKKPSGTITSWLRESSTLKMYSSLRPGDGLHAVTHYKTLQTSRAFSLLEVQLETGRKNQIRVHMQDIGHPIASDKKYGSRSRSLGRLGLHAKSLEFLHPSTDKLMRFEANIPKSFLRVFNGENGR